MPYIDNVLIGPFRVFLIFMVVLFVHQIVTKQPIKNYNLDYILKRVSSYGSAILLLIFLLVQFNMYNIFSLITLFFTLLGLQYLGINKLNTNAKDLAKKKEDFLLGFFTFLESKSSFRNQLKKNIQFFIPKKTNYIVATAFIVSLACFISRYLFLKNDLYTLSELWLNNLKYVKQFNANVWFSDNFSILGENIFINFYSKITGISEEMAVHSFGLLEIFSISIIFYWVLVKITKSPFVAPMLGVLFFALFYKFMPININFLLEHNAIYMAILFALPAMLYTVIPKLLSKNKKKYFVLLLIIYMSLSFISLFIALLIMPIFLITALVCKTKKTLPYILYSILSYITGTLIIISIYAIACWSHHISLLSFLHKNLILVNVYTYFPQLITTPENIIIIYGCIGWTATFSLIPMLLKNRNKWAPALTFLLFFNAVVVLKWVYWDWIDIDLFYQTISVFTILLIGITIGIIIHYLRISIPKKHKTKPYFIGSLFIGVLLISYYVNGFYKYNFEESENLKTDVLLVYDNLSNNNLPFSYAVVNNDYAFKISENEHHFINYKNFLDNYIKRDSIYQSIKNDEHLLRERSGDLLPNSIFVFISKNKLTKKNNTIGTPYKYRDPLLKQIELLKTKGRKTRLFWETDSLFVYEIINKENASKLDELIFNL